MEMIESRILTAHTYNEELSGKVANAVKEKYFTQFIFLRDTLD